MHSGVGKAQRGRRPIRGTRCRAIADANDPLPVTLLRSGVDGHAPPPSLFMAEFQTGTSACFFTILQHGLGLFYVVDPKKNLV
jgi:hypothetical protein